MKKLLLSAAIAAFAFTSVNAQEGTPELKSKKGETFLPEAGDWAIQIDGAPYLKSAFNVFNSTGSNSVTPDFPNDIMAITGKYFKDANTAYRVKANLTFGSDSETADNGDKMTISGSAIVLGAGIEKRRGKTRLQGFYGAEALIMFASGKETFEATGYSYEEKYGSSFGLGVRGFIGAEYFILPKFSIGAEYGWGIGFQSTSASEITETGMPVVRGSKTSSFGALTDISGGALNLTLHF